MSGRSPRHRIGSLAVGAALVVAACGGSLAPSASPTTPVATAASPAASPAVTSTPPPTALVTPVPTVVAPSQPTLDFTPGTTASPRIVALTVDDALNFTPGLVRAAPGETVTFRLHNVGKAVHEFMIGKLDDAFADLEGTPEVADIQPATTAQLTFTFAGSGPFAFACHAPGHFEHGMLGYVELVGPGAPTVGTAADPRVVPLAMDDTLHFTPDTITVAKGETIRFVLTNEGKVVHEFQVGPADKVAADDVDGVVVLEQDELDAGSTHAVDYTFNGPGPYAFACHEPGHYEAGMKGTIQLVGS